MNATFRCSAPHGHDGCPFLQIFSCDAAGDPGEVFQPGRTFQTIFSYAVAGDPGEVFSRDAVELTSTFNCGCVTPEYL